MQNLYAHDDEVHVITGNRLVSRNGDSWSVRSLSFDVGYSGIRLSVRLRCVLLLSDVSGGLSAELRGLKWEKQTWDRTTENKREDALKIWPRVSLA